MNNNRLFKSKWEILHGKEYDIDQKIAEKLYESEMRPVIIDAAVFDRVFVAKEQERKNKEHGKQ